jgi:predicted AAA+ superfamily ATPase
MIERYTEQQVVEALNRQAAVAIIGPRQVGKTTLALKIADTRSSSYLDLESPTDRAKLQEPELFFLQNHDKLIILDEIHRVPELFQVLRGIIDQSRRDGRRNGLFLILGSASVDMLRQSGESLAGRIAYVNMSPISPLEIPEDRSDQDRLWLRGGFPDSYLADSDHQSISLREDFIRTYLERDVVQFGPRIPAETLRRLWTMLAHNQGQLLNSSRLASSLETSSPTVGRYVDLLVDLLLVRRLAPLHSNLGKRMVKSPKVFVRDSGLLHALLALESLNDLQGHPVVGSSWEGFVIEALVSAAPAQTIASFYRTTGGAEVDLVLDLGGTRGRWAIEVKRGLTPKVSRGLLSAQADLEPDQTFVVYSGEESYPLKENITAIGLGEIVRKIAMP